MIFQFEWPDIIWKFNELKHIQKETESNQKY